MNKYTDELNVSFVKKLDLYILKIFLLYYILHTLHIGYCDSRVTC